MKKITALLVICYVAMSCGSRVPPEEQLKDAIEAAEQSEATEMDIFLGFKFGMTDEQLTEHLNDLEQAEKVYVDHRGAYAYDFHTRSTIIKLTFKPRYYNGELYRLDFAMSNYENSIGSPELNTVLGASTFQDSGQTGFQSFITENIIGETIYTFIKGNLIVQFEPFSSGMMSYINAPIERVQREEVNLQKNNDRDRTLSDF